MTPEWIAVWLAAPIGLSPLTQLLTLGTHSVQLCVMLCAHKRPFTQGSPTEPLPGRPPKKDLG